jgi:epoxide hydrolase-like predicted phosphatase
MDALTNQKTTTKQNNITTIFFDVGGVMVVDYVDHKVLDLAEKYDKDPDLMLHLRKKYRVLADMGQISDKEFWQKVLETVNVTAVEDDWKFESYEEKIEGGIEIAEQLKQQGYRIAVLSNDSKQSSDYRRQKYNFDSLFDDAIFSYQYGIIKPEPKLFEIALKKLKVAPDQSVFIDDRLENITASERIGIHSILFKNSKQLIGELGRLGVMET